MFLIVGNASRKCDSNGNWGTPVYINCVNEILHKTTEKVSMELDKMSALKLPFINY